MGNIDAKQTLSTVDGSSGKAQEEVVNNEQPLPSFREEIRLSTEENVTATAHDAPSVNGVSSNDPL